MTMVWSPDYLGSPGKLVLSNPLTCTNTAKGENKLYSDAKGVVPSLDLRFAESKTLNDYMTATPLVDHQRSMSGANLSPGTFVNSSGLIETAKVNLLTRSQEFNESNWVKAGSGVAVAPSVTANAEIAPDGTLTADRVVFSLNGGTSLSDISDLRQTAVTGTGTYTVSFYIRSFDGTSSYSFLLRDANGIVSLFNVTGSWQRIEVSSPNYLAGSKFIGFVLRGGTGTSSSADILVWGAQLEEGATATTYIPTTNVPSAAPRFDHDPTTGESLGLLVEESRTNLFDYSTDLTQWTGSNSAAPVASSEIAPDGSTDAYKLNINIGGTSYFYRNVPTVAGNVYTISVWAKNVPGEQNYFDLFFNTSGSVQLGKTALTDTWTRYHITGTATQTANVFAGINNPPDDYTARGLFWGFQFELGAFPTSYIPTTGTALTRSADDASITGSNFSSWYNQSEGTFFTNLGSQGLGLPARIQAIETGTGNRIQLRDGQAYCFNATQQFYLFYSSALKEAFAFSGSSTSVANSGTIVATAGTANLPNCSELELGSRSNSDYLNGTISRLTYFPERLPDSSLQTMTTP
jgi:hypothetical protein